jgi:histidinol-phosphate aminotransferase
MTIRFADHLKDIPEYIPGKPVEELERELGVKEAVKMASNENFWGPPQKVIAAIADKIQRLNLYPDSGCFLLREALSKKNGVPKEQVIVGNGSNYLIELICRSVLNPGEEGITCDPSFLFYKRAIKGAIGVPKSIPMKDFEVDIEDLLRGVSDRTRLILLASPNNPTGKIIPFPKITWLMNRLDPGVLVVLDEAYFDYVDSMEARSGLTLLKDHKNLMVLKTFSKIYSLAGLRIGYGISHETILQGLMKLYLPFNVGTLAQAAALAFLEEDSLNETRRIHQEGKKYLYNELNDLGLEYVPTEANFILMRVGEATRVYEGLLKRGIIVRDMTPWKLPEHIRVTISTLENNKRFIREFSELYRKEIRQGVKGTRK